MGFNPNERLTLAAILSGLQGGMSGDQAMPLLSSVMASRDQRRADNRELMMQALGASTNFAGTAENNDASQAYLYALQDAGLFRPRQMDKITAFNTALYPGEDSRSPLYGLVGDMARLNPTSSSGGVPVAITGIPDSELQAWGTSNPAIYSAVIASGSTDREAIYDAIVKNPNSPAEAYFAINNPDAVYQAIDAYLGTNPEDSSHWYDDLGGKLLGGYMGGKVAQWGLGKIGTAVPGLGGLISKIPWFGSKVVPVAAEALGGAGAAGAAEAAAAAAAPAAAEGLAGLAAGAGAEAALGAAGTEAALSAAGASAGTGYGIPIAAAILLTLAAKYGWDHQFMGWNDGEGLL